MEIWPGWIGDHREPPPSIFFSVFAYSSTQWDWRQCCVVQREKCQISCCFSIFLRSMFNGIRQLLRPETGNNNIRNQITTSKLWGTTTRKIFKLVLLFDVFLSFFLFCLFVHQTGFHGSQKLNDIWSCCLPACRLHDVNSSIMLELFFLFQIYEDVAEERIIGGSKGL